MHLPNKQFVGRGGNLWRIIPENEDIQICKDKCMENSFSHGHIVYQYCIGFYTFKDCYGRFSCQFKAASATMVCEDATREDMYILTNDKKFECA